MTTRIDGLGVTEMTAAGHTAREIAEALGASTKTVQRCQRAQGCVRPAIRKQLGAEQLAQIEAVVDDDGVFVSGSGANSRLQSHTAREAISRPGLEHMHRPVPSRRRRNDWRADVVGGQKPGLVGNLQVVEPDGHFPELSSTGVYVDLGDGPELHTFEELQTMIDELDAFAEWVGQHIYRPARI